MKLHRTAAFQRLHYILRSGSILTRVKFNVGLTGGGFNSKNKKERESPIDPRTRPVNFLPIRRPPRSSCGLSFLFLTRLLIRIISALP